MTQIISANFAKRSRITNYFANLMCGLYKGTIDILKRRKENNNFFIINRTLPESYMGNNSL
jgi:hypothetical protein